MTRQQTMSSLQLFLLTATGLFCLASCLTAASAPIRVRLPTDQSPLVALSQPLGNTAPAQKLALAIALPLRNQATMTQLLHSLYDPTSPQYRRYLTPAQFTAQFGPTQADYNAVIAFARASGLTVTGTHPERTLLDVSGPASAVTAAFAVQLGQYESPSGRIFHAPTSSPTVPSSLGGKIAAVVGLDNAVLRQPNLRKLDYGPAPEDVPPTQGTGPGGSLTPSDIRTAYNLTSSAFTGAGQTLAVFELDTYTPKDILRYEKAFGLPTVPLENVSVDASDPDFPVAAGAGTAEVVLDIDMQIALAPKAAKVLVYIGPNTAQGAVDLYQQIATDNRASAISTSWGLWEDLYLSDTTQDDVSAFLIPEYTAFVQMTMQGQTLFSAAGDYGGVDPYTGYLSVEDPASQPYVCGVGGTTLRVKKPGVDEHYLSETTWNIDGDPADGAGGGGVSYIWAIPDYQEAAANFASKNSFVSTEARNVPDISLNSDPYTGYLIYVTDPKTGPSFYIYGGTSAAAPLWAGFAALVNQQRAAQEKEAIGFINPALYSFGPGGTYASRYSADFHDIADGSDNIPYPALKGYDAATGLGTMNGANLLGDLVALP